MGVIDLPGDFWQRDARPRDLCFIADDFARVEPELQLFCFVVVGDGHEGLNVEDVGGEVFEFSDDIDGFFARDATLAVSLFEGIAIGGPCFISQSRSEDVDRMRIWGIESDDAFVGVVGDR